MYIFIYITCCRLFGLNETYSHNNLNHNRNTIHTQTQKTLSFQTRTVYQFLDFGPWRHEERDTIFTMLTPPQRAAHLVMFKIPIHHCRSRPTCLNGQNPTPAPMVLSQLRSFQNPPILRTICSGHDVIHTPPQFPIWEVIMTNGDCHILCVWV